MGDTAILDAVYRQSPSGGASSAQPEGGSAQCMGLMTIARPLLGTRNDMQHANMPLSHSHLQHANMP